MRFAFPALFAVLSAATAPQDAVPLRLQFRAGERQDLRFDMNMKMDMEVASDAVNMKQGMDGTILFTFRNTCKKVVEGGYVCDAMFDDLEMDQRVAVGDQNVKVTVRGRKVKMEGPDGLVVVDTEKEVNPKLAEPILKELAGFGESMEIEMDARGLIKDGKKGKALPKLLQGVASSGNLYPFVLPDKPVQVGDEWTHENEISSLGEMTLEGKPIKVPLKYRLERFEGEGALRVAVLSTKVDAEFKDIVCAGKMEGVGAEVALKIAKLTYKGTGETRFIPATGRVERSALDLTLKSEMTAEAQELGGALAMKRGLGIKAKISPTTPKKRDF
jgi:hypothetical protein